MTMTDLCAELNNYFERDVKHGEFEIIYGQLNVDFIANGQYFRISGSIFNDGVYKFGVDKLTDEKFSGEIWLLAIPPAVVALADDISKWTEKNADVISSPYSSESFGGYSYSKSSGDNSGAGSVGATWQAQFRTQLNKWRKV